MSNEATNPASCQTAVSGSTFSIHDLKCGNLLNYDTAEGEILPTVIDWQDLKWLTEDPKGFNLVHSPIKLTNEMLLSFGFKDEGTHLQLNLANNWSFEWFDNLLGFSLCKGNKGLKLGKIEYVHELQNLHYSFTGVMLSLS
jgi:hypothetical protein